MTKARQQKRVPPARLAGPAPGRWWQRNSQELAICGLLAVAAFVVFGATTAFPFVAYDDDVYVTDNLHVRGGLSPAGVGWAFTHVHAANWHPLTTLSHMLDCSLFKLKPWGHHLSSVVLHAMAAVMLFMALLRMTAARWRSAIVAAAFCLHPLHVESVAWVAERKDVLSGLFFGLTLWAYAVYAEKPFSLWRYATVLASIALGLLCKPMLVTLPFLLLLLDYWPLKRFGAASGEPGSDGRERGAANVAQCVLEKLPLFALAAGSCAITYLVQSAAGTISTDVTLEMRCQTALAAYSGYLNKAIWPVGLAAPYPLVTQIPAWTSIAEAAGMAGITAAAAFFGRRGAGYVAVGWLWFVGMLVPVIGFVPIGDQSMADRYTYLPLTGIFIAVVWGAADLLGPRRAAWGAAAATAVLLIWGGLSIRQTGYWSDSEKLFSHALEVAPNNPLAATNLGIVLKQQGRKEEAMQCFHAALVIRPTYYLALHNLGIALLEQHDWAGAIDLFRASLASRPNNAMVHDNLGYALASNNRMPEAQQEFEEALRLDPDYTKAENNLAIALTAQGRAAEAFGHLRRVVELDPEYAQGHVNLGMALAAQGSADEAIGEFLVALRLQPNNLMARRELAKVYARSGRPDAAAEQWREVLRLQPPDVEARQALERGSRSGQGH
jgi:protein O-mannosyl-transferase